MTRKTAKRKSYCRKSRKHMVRGGGEEYMSKGGASTTLTITENTAGTDPLSTVPTDIVSNVQTYINMQDHANSTIIPLDDNSRNFISSLVDGSVYHMYPPKDGFKITYKQDEGSDPVELVLLPGSSTKTPVSHLFGSKGVLKMYREYKLVFTEANTPLDKPITYTFYIVKQYGRLDPITAKTILCIIQLKEKQNILPAITSGTFTVVPFVREKFNLGGPFNSLVKTIDDYGKGFEEVKAIEREQREKSKGLKENKEE